VSGGEWLGGGAVGGNGGRRVCHGACTTKYGCSMSDGLLKSFL
jgi:hypothetical protein